MAQHLKRLGRKDSTTKVKLSLYLFEEFFDTIKIQVYGVVNILLRRLYL